MDRPTTYRLISRTATTGWWDWQHGELWLAPDALLRHRRGWLQTFASVGLAQDVLANATDPLMEQRFTQAAVDRMIKQGGGWWIPAESIEAGRLRAGFMTGRLFLQLDDGQTAKFLWAKSNLTYGALLDALTGWLGGGLSLD